MVDSIQGMKHFPYVFSAMLTLRLSWLHGWEQHPLVDKVHSPGLVSSPPHELGKKIFKNGFGAVLPLMVKAEGGNASSWSDSLQLVSPLANVGDAKTLIIHPSATTHQQLSDRRTIIGRSTAKLVTGGSWIRIYWWPEGRFWTGISEN